MTVPLISVIMPAWNAAGTIGAALDSIAAQQVPGLEVIVVNDGSDDTTAEVAAGHPLRPAVIYQQNGGPPVARNRGIDVAKGEWIAFLDVDDIWPAGSLARRMETLLRRPELLYVVGQVQFEAHDQRASPPLAWTAPNLGSGLFRREVFAQVGRFDAGLRYIDDVDWFWRARDAGVPSESIAETTLIYRRHGHGLTAGRSWNEMGLPEVIRRALVRRREKREAAL
jgi:glycosyltransferase involved in cell wall biosynthesis